jgi:hypothetical protein
MAETIRETVSFGPLPGGDVLRAKLTFRSVVPELAIPEPADAAYDFSASIAFLLDLPETEWRMEGLSISRRVPMRILREFFDGALLYAAAQLGRLRDVLGAMADRRILVKCLAGMPELMVKYRYYLGLANDDGEYKIYSGSGDDLQLIGIRDPYDRLFWLTAPPTRNLIVREYGKSSVVVKGSRELTIYGKGCRPRSVLGFRWCLDHLVGKDDPVRKFLDAVYSNVRIPEYHSCRLGDNVLFQIPRLVAGLVGAMNYLFTNDLLMPYESRERGPFKPRLFRLAGTRPLAGGKMEVRSDDVSFPLDASFRCYS